MSKMEIGIGRLINDCDEGGRAFFFDIQCRMVLSNSMCVLVLPNWCKMPTECSVFQIENRVLNFVTLPK